MKYLKYLIILFYFLKIQNLVNSQICPTTLVDYSFEDARCDSDMKNLLFPTLYIKNYYNFTNIKSSPSAISQIIQNSVYIITLDYNIEYTISLTHPNCPKNLTITKKTSNNPRLIIQQPKCQNSNAIIQFNSDQKHSNQSLYLNDTKIQSPYELFFKDFGLYSFYTLDANGNKDCEQSFYLQSGNIVMNPVLKIIHGTCGKNGKITIENLNDYSSITLFNKENNIIASNTNGIYNGLLSGDYLLQLQSNTCSKQQFAINIQNVPPSYQLLLIEDLCPNKPKYEIKVDTILKFNISINNQNVGNPFTFQSSNKALLNIEQCGSYPISIKIDDSFPPIQYTLPEFDFCNNETNVTIIYDKINNLQIYNSSENQFITLDKQNSFKAKKDLTYLISDDCFLRSYSISLPQRQPVYSLSKPKTDYCNDLFDVTILNYLDFDSLYLEDQMVKYYPTKGEFKQIPQHRYILHYNYRGCHNGSLDIYPDNRIALINYTSNVLSTPTCSNPNGGIVEFTIFDGFTKKQIDRFNETFKYSPTLPFFSTFNFVNWFQNHTCVYYYDLNITIAETQFIIKTLSKPTCKYSKNQDPIISIIPLDSNVKITTIAINDAIQTVSDSYKVKLGNNTISINSSGPSGSCKTVTLYYFAEPKYPNFEVKYDTTQITNCAIGNGGFSIKDYKNYSLLKIGNYSLLSNSGSSGFNYSSGLYSLDFSIDLGQNNICSNTIDIFIPTLINVTINYTMIQQPLCEGDNSGEIVFENIIDKNGKYYDIQMVNGSSKLHRDNISPGFYTFNFKSGTCSWNAQMNISPLNVTITPVLKSSYVSQCVIYSSYLLSYDNSLAQSTSIVNGISDPNTKNNLNFNNNFNNIYGVNITYGNNGVCFKNIKIQLSYLEYKEIKYKVSKFHGDIDCMNGNSTIDIQVFDFKNYSTLKYMDVSIDSDGYFRNVKLYGSIVGILIGFECPITTSVSFDRQTLEINKKIIPQTCKQSWNGEIIIDDPNKNNYNYISLIKNLDGNNLNSIIIDENNSFNFNLIGDGQYTILRIRRDHPTCFSNQSVNINSIEPNLLIDNNCDTLNILNVRPNNSMLNGIFTLSNDTFINNYTTIANNLYMGNYTISYNITSDFCKRSFYKNISISKETCIQSNTNNKNYLALKIALPIGLFFLLLITTITIVAIIYKKKKSQTPIEPKPNPPILHKQSTFKLFTGKKLVDVDKF